MFKHMILALTLLLDVAFDFCVDMKRHTHTNTHTHYPQRATRANISHLNTEKRLAISQRSWVPLITRAFKRESGERRWACNEPLGGEVDGHSR